jgi:hypothetical protein
MNGVGTARIGPHGSVFIVMPYTSPHSGDLAKLIRDTCQVNLFEGRLADEPIDPATELRVDIFEHLRQAELVVVDLAGENPNVRYELGVARALGKRVILLYPSSASLPPGLDGLPSFRYGDLGKDADRRQVRDFLDGCLQTVQAEVMPQVLDTVEDRTTRIVADLGALARMEGNLLRRQTVWWSGFLSSFAVSPGEAFEHSERSAKEELLAERQALVELARAGCRIVSIISPRRPDTPDAPGSRIALMRMKSLLAFLDSGDPALENIDWLIAPRELKNFCIVGNICCYERFQKANDRGVALTLRQASAAAVRANTAVYELLFEEFAYMTLDGKPPCHVVERRKALRRKTAEALKDAIAASDDRTMLDQALRQVENPCQDAR